MTMRVLIMAGGTGGHVFPALAVAEELIKQGHEVLWLGARAGLEARVIPPTGIPLAFISISGLRGKGWWSWLLAPYKLGIAFLQSLTLLIKLKPGVVLGMGGFVSGPGGFSAWLLDKALVIHEQNAVAGLTNRWLAPLADKVLEGFPGSLEKNTSLCIPATRCAPLSPRCLPPSSVSADAVVRCGCWCWAAAWVRRY